MKADQVHEGFVHVVLATFSEDAKPADIEAFLASAARILANAPFPCEQSGQATRDDAAPSAADWGFVAWMRSVEQLEAWTASEPHRLLGNDLRAIRQTVVTFQIPGALNIPRERVLGD